MRGRSDKKRVTDVLTLAPKLPAARPLSVTHLHDRSRFTILPSLVLLALCSVMIFICLSNNQILVSAHMLPLSSCSSCAFTRHQSLVCIHQSCTFLRTIDHLVLFLTPTSIIYASVKERVSFRHLLLHYSFYIDILY